MQGRSKQSTCLWSNPIIADLVESKIQRSQSAVCWNPDSQRIKTYLRCPSCCNLVWEWKDLNSAAGPLWLSVRPMTAILAVIINLPIVSTDGVFEGKKRQGVRTTEPRHSARQQHALGVLVPVLNLVSYRRMSASDKRWRTLSRVGVALACVVRVQFANFTLTMRTYFSLQRRCLWLRQFGAWGWRKLFSLSFLGRFIPSWHMYHTLLELSFAMIYPLKQFYLELLKYVVVTSTSFVLEITVWFWTITWKPRREVLFTIIVHIIYVKCTTINCRLSMHEIRHHKYPYYFTNKDACSKWISHESRILVELWNELFETSTNSVSSSKFIVKTSHETVKSNLFYGKSGINSCQVPHH